MTVDRAMYVVLQQSRGTTSRGTARAAAATTDRAHSFNGAGEYIPGDDDPTVQVTRVTLASMVPRNHFLGDWLMRRLVRVGEELQ